MYKMTIPAGFFGDDFKKAEAYCKHFNCRIYPAKRGTAVNVIETEDPINFFWLGVNFDRQAPSALTITAYEQHLVNIK